MNHRRSSAGSPEDPLAAAEAARDDAQLALEAARREHAHELAMLTAEMNSILDERYQAKEALKQLSAQANAGACGQAAGPLGPTAAVEVERARTRVRELEGALKQAVRDYQALLKEVVVLRGAVRDAKEVARQHEARAGPQAPAHRSPAVSLSCMRIDTGMTACPSDCCVCVPPSLQLTTQALGDAREEIRRLQERIRDMDRELSGARAELDSASRRRHKSSSPRRQESPRRSGGRRHGGHHHQHGGLDDTRNVGVQVKPHVQKGRSEYAARCRDDRYSEVAHDWVADALGEGRLR